MAVLIFGQRERAGERSHPVPGHYGPIRGLNITLHLLQAHVAPDCRDLRCSTAGFCQRQQESALSNPSWDTPARLNGLPCRNWKKREGVTLDGTLDECLTRWLDLAGHQKADCTLGWGPTAERQQGSWSANAIASYVRRNGLPPSLASRRGGHLGAADLARLTSMDRYDPPPGPGDTPPLPAERSHRMAFTGTRSRNGGP
jgi:hypothetical protein